MTAKLSLKFYERLGEEVATELVEWFNSVDATYRSDLRELNELNFARFDAKVDQRIGVLEAKLDQRSGVFEAKLDQRIGVLEAKLDQRIGVLEAKLERRVAELRGEIGSVRQDLRDSIANLRAELIKWSFVFFATAALAVIGLR